MAFRPIVPVETAAPEWEPYGLPDEPSTLERHRDTAEVRVRPSALADMLAEWEALDDPA